MLDCIESFVSELRVLHAKIYAPVPRWEAIEARMASILANESLRTHAQTWPETVFSGTTERISVGNLLFYEDSNHRFALAGSIRQPGLKSNIHCHGPAWTLYGLIEGAETIERYERRDGRLVRTGTVTARPGDVDLVRPGEIPREVNGAERSVAFIVRSRRSGTFTQYRYSEDGTAHANTGPKLTPFALD